MENKKVIWIDMDGVLVDFNGHVKETISNNTFLRGINFEKSYIILDEAQNASPQQLKTLITRISDDAKLIIEGDLSQCDKYKNNGSPAYTKSGFFDVWKRLGKLKGVYQIEFTKDFSFNPFSEEELNENEVVITD